MKKLLLIFGILSLTSCANIEKLIDKACDKIEGTDLPDIITVSGNSASLKCEKVTK